MFRTKRVNNGEKNRKFQGEVVVDKLIRHFLYVAVVSKENRAKARQRNVIWMDGVSLEGRYVGLRLDAGWGISIYFLKIPSQRYCTHFTN